MKVVLLGRAYVDLLWFRRYYKSVFPEGAAKARLRYRQALERLAEMPFAGHQVPDRAVRILAVTQTPFLLIYRVADDSVEVLRVWDARAERVEDWVGDGS